MCTWWLETKGGQDMGQKINPTGFRLAVSRNWASRWYASNRDFAGMLAEDIKVREFLKAKLKNAAVSRILIERPAKNARITIFSARPGVVKIVMRAFLAGRSIRMRDTAAFFSLAF